METTLKKLQEVIMEITEADDKISVDINLADAGVQSIEIVELFVAVEKNFGVKLPDDMYGTDISITLLSDYIMKNKN